MHLQLTEDECAVLRELLEWRLGSLSVEISHTDNPDYRRGLREHRETLRRIRDALTAASASQATTQPETVRDSAQG
jgi:hypothetical protein